MNISLPPLRSLIFRGYAILVGIFGVAGVVLLLWTVVLAANITPRLLHRNYDSINAAMQMRDAWYAIRHPSEHPQKSKSQFRTQFENALAFEKNNTTERGELDVASAVEKLWRETNELAEVDDPRFYQMDDYLSQLIEINREGMFRAAEEAQGIKAFTLRVTILSFLLGLVLMFYRADSIATAIANPLKDIAETLRGKPKPGERLRLPTQPNSLEVRILIQEIRNLWDRVSEANRTNVEEILRQSQKLQAVLASVEDAVLVLGERGLVTHCNEKMLSLIELSREHVVGQYWSDLPSMSENYLNLRNTLTPELSDEKVLELNIQNGVESYAGRVRSVADSEGAEVAKVYLLHNITEKRQRERLKAEFIGVLSHELKTPLQSLGTATELLVDKKSRFDEQTRLLVETIHEDVGRIRGVTNDFVQVSQLEHPSLALRLELDPCDLREQLPRWIKPFLVVAQEKKIDIHFTSESGKTDVNVDSIKFPWVVSNLLSNAIRNTPTGGKISVMLSTSGNSAVISVADEGPGVPVEIESRIFEPYFKSTSDQDSRTAGFLGIGLTIAKEVIEAHGGTIRYEKGQTKGAVFSVRIPLQVRGSV